MKSCNAEAADRRGDERKAFISSCLKAGATTAPMTQQDKMMRRPSRSRGDERKSFMSECLKADRKL
jgi:psiF repeat-containing protein